MRGRKEDNHLLLRPHPFMKVISPNSVPTKPWRGTHLHRHPIVVLVGTVMGIWWAQEKRSETQASDLVFCGGR